MPSYREIVTKAVIHKTTKKISKEYEVLLEHNVSKVIGAYILNHKVTGKIVGNTIKIDGVFDTNIWYSYDNNSKTSVSTSRCSYEEELVLDLLDETYEESNDVKINYITLPACSKADINETKILYEIQMNLNIQVIGEATIKISTVEEVSEDIENIEIDENYLKE